MERINLTNTQANSKKAFIAERVSWNIGTAISMRDNGFKERRKVMACMNGQMATITMVIGRKIQRKELGQLASVESFMMENSTLAKSTDWASKLMKMEIQSRPCGRVVKLLKN